MSEARTDWGAVFAGAVLATAIALVLIAFGAALGLGITSPYEGEGAAPALFVLAAGLWLLWIQLASFSCGGYVAARLRTRRTDESEHEADVCDGLHGVLVWAVGVIAAAVISFGGLGAVGATAASVDRAGAPAAIEAMAAEAAQAGNRAAAEEPAANQQAIDESLAERQAEIARKLGVLAAFATAAALLAGAVAAFFAAQAGGNHRDRNTVLPFFVRPRERGIAAAPRKT